MSASIEVNLDHANYWSRAFECERSFVIEHWKAKYYVNLISLSWSVFKRLFASYFCIPPIILFFLFCLEAHSSGLAATLTTILTALEGGVSESDASLLVRIWHCASLLIFMMSWVLKWKSPAKRFAESEMDLWHRVHGDKMLQPKSS